ncbi:hypothetical protein M569_12820 [Genlisea aurea]|uniref:Uncharacterized protein n=1 Tax=Genlisea aurea TaxID=192259 RepID=S8DGP7_9LAMI|nr:hypothetical protein M569_12820 [Genlisea aurea]
MRLRPLFQSYGGSYPPDSVELWTLSFPGATARGLLSPGVKVLSASECGQAMVSVLLRTMCSQSLMNANHLKKQRPTASDPEVLYACWLLSQPACRRVALFRGLGGETNPELSGDWQHLCHLVVWPALGLVCRDGTLNATSLQWWYSYKEATPWLLKASLCKMAAVGRVPQQQQST